MAVSPAMGVQTPAEGIDLWIAKLKSERYSPRTIELYAQIIRKYLKQDPLPTSMSIRSYLAKRLEGAASPARAANERKALKSVFTFLHDEGLWNTNPMSAIKSIRVRYRERRCPSEEDIQKLLSAECYHKTDTTKFKMMLILLLDTGLRITEAASILKEGIDLRNMAIRVIGKGDKERFVPISPITAALLQRYIASYCPNGHRYIFPGDNELGYWDIRSFEKSLKKMCGRLGIEQITPHQLRHYFATVSLRNGAKLEVISRILGHSSVGITADIYRHVMRDEMQDQHRLFCPLSRMGGLLVVGRTDTGEDEGG
jgi:site-specific recombinase XerD